MDLLERITVDPDKCGGRPCIRGLRIRVTDILAMLAEGVSHEDVLHDFPYLEADDIKAALAYAARQADHAVLYRPELPGRRATPSGDGGLDFQPGT
jgi:uncharacterized protein (DUF433 family)